MLAQKTVFGCLVAVALLLAAVIVVLLLMLVGLVPLRYLPSGS